MSGAAARARSPVRPATHPDVTPTHGVLLLRVRPVRPLPKAVRTPPVVGSRTRGAHSADLVRATWADVGVGRAAREAAASRRGRRACGVRGAELARRAWRPDWADGGGHRGRDQRLAGADGGGGAVGG
eukprot:2178760-Prymnesium_polylepis.2